MILKALALLTMIGTANASSIQDEDPILNTVAEEVVVTIETSKKLTIIDLGKQIRDETFYEEVIETLKSADKDHTIQFEIHNIGGDMDGMISILNALDVTKAHTVAHVTTSGQSAAAVIACHCDEIALEPYSFLMFHDVSFATGQSKSHDILEMTKMTRQVYKKTLDACVVNGVLTDQEVENIMNGQDVYKSGDDIKK